MLFSGKAFGMNQDPEIHRIIGGLYSIAVAVDINGTTNPTTSQLRRYFTNIPGDWNNSVKISRVNNSIWAGISVGRFSSARKFLRSNANELEIMDSPGGYAWMSGDYAWLKVGEISNGKLNALKISSARGAGEDRNIIFLNSKNSWWQSNPTFTSQTAQNVLNKYGVKNPPVLHAPEQITTSIYESVKPASVKVPDKIHISRDRSIIDEFSTEIGDVIFNPIPNTRP